MSSDTAHLPPSGNPNDKRPLAPLPRLRIHHFMLWTAVTAGWLALARIVFDTLPGQQSMVQLNLLAAAIAYGAATAVTGLGIYWRAKGMAFFTQPGHWLACWIMLTSLWFVATHLLVYWLLQDTADGYVLANANESLLLWLARNEWIRVFVTCVCLLFLAVRAADTLAWRVLFVSWAIIECAPTLMLKVGLIDRLASAGLLKWFLFIPVLAEVILLAIPALNDFQRRRTLRRHWTHWAGFVVAGTQILYGLVLLPGNLIALS